MLTKRIIVCLDVRDGRVVKGVNFRGLRDVGDPVELAARYEAEGADEVVFLDISASIEGRQTLLDVVQRTAERLFIPLTVGGGIQDISDIEVGTARGRGQDQHQHRSCDAPGADRRSRLAVWQPMHCGQH